MLSGFVSFAGAAFFMKRFGYEPRELFTTGNDASKFQIVNAFSMEEGLAPLMNNAVRDRKLLNKHKAKLSLLGKETDESLPGLKETSTLANHKLFNWLQERYNAIPENRDGTRRLSPALVFMEKLLMAKDNATIADYDVAADFKVYKDLLKGLDAIAKEGGRNPEQVKYFPVELSARNITDTRVHEMANIFGLAYKKADPTATSMSFAFDSLFAVCQMFSNWATDAAIISAAFYADRLQSEKILPKGTIGITASVLNVLWLYILYKSMLAMQYRVLSLLRSPITRGKQRDPIYDRWGYTFKADTKEKHTIGHSIAQRMEDLFEQPANDAQLFENMQKRVTGRTVPFGICEAILAAGGLLGGASDETRKSTWRWMANLETKREVIEALSRKWVDAPAQTAILVIGTGLELTKLSPVLANLWTMSKGLLTMNYLASNVRTIQTISEGPQGALGGLVYVLNVLVQYHGMANVFGGSYTWGVVTTASVYSLVEWFIAFATPTTVPGQAIRQIPGAMRFSRQVASRLIGQPEITGPVADRETNSVYYTAKGLQVLIIFVVLFSQILQTLVNVTRDFALPFQYTKNTGTGRRTITY
jgi:hypothetical protein